MKKLLFRLLFFVVIVCVACVVFLFFAKTKMRGPAVYSAGYQKISIQVPHRSAPLSAHIWYPSDDDVEPQLIGQNALFYGHYVRLNAKPKSGNLPLIIFSHGSGGNALQSGWLAESLAQQGYVVLAANHAGTMTRNSLPEKTVMVWERANDLRELINWAENPTADDLSLNTDAVGAIGFSLGGHSVLALSGLRLSKNKFIEYCDTNANEGDCGWLARGGVDLTKIDKTLYEASYLDPRIKATIAIDPALTAAMTKDSAENAPYPILIINLQPSEGMPKGLDATNIAQTMPKGQYQIIPQSWHFSFLPECSLLGRIVMGGNEDDNICSDRKLTARSDVHLSIASHIISFLNETL